MLVQPRKSGCLFTRPEAVHGKWVLNQQGGTVLSHLIMEVVLQLCMLLINIGIFDFYFFLKKSGILFCNFKKSVGCCIK